MQPAEKISLSTQYAFAIAEPEHTHRYLYPVIMQMLESESIERIFDLGCGNGATLSWLAETYPDVCGVDPSEEGVQQARIDYPQANVELGSAFEDLSALYGTFYAVVSLEVVEHLFNRPFSGRRFSLSHASLHKDGGEQSLS